MAKTLLAPSGQQRHPRAGIDSVMGLRILTVSFLSAANARSGPIPFGDLDHAACKRLSLGRSTIDGR